MPKLTEFKGVSQGYVSAITDIGMKAVAGSIKIGSEYMRNGIGNRPTGSTWHIDKNRANNFDDGARIGNNNPNFGSEGVDPNSGLMLSAVSSSGPTRSSSGKKIAGKYGWINTKQPYFLLQDVGNYGVGKQSGMGLLNEAMNPTSSVTQFGAKVEAEQEMIKSMKSAGFKYIFIGELF
jgi:hypothetical protein